MASPEALKVLRDLQLSDENKVCGLTVQRHPRSPSQAQVVDGVCQRRLA
jgi:hypothetical protein